MVEQIIETDYQRAWRERGEAEAALRKWRSNHTSPAFTKGTGIAGGLVGASILMGFIHDPSWELAPALVLAAMFMATLFLAPSILRDQEKQRAEAKATLQRLGLWERVGEK